MTAQIADIRIPYPDATLLRPLSDAELHAYHRDGAAIIREVIPPEWLDFMRAAIARIMRRSDTQCHNFSRDGEPRFFSQFFPWMFDDAFKAWALHGPLVDVARQALDEARSLVFFFDQIFAKEPGCTTDTPWHQDLPYLPVVGEQHLRIWVPFDRVTAEGGAVHYLRGSHSWNTIYRPADFRQDQATTDPLFQTSDLAIPDFTAEYDRHDWLVGETEPGDLILHHPRTVHGGFGNVTDNLRRAVASVYVGDKATWNPHSANMFNHESIIRLLPIPDLEPGAPLESELFPRVWP